MTEYILGVDGGNSKTHYALFDSCGNPVNFIRAGTASHENIGYEGMKQELDKRIHELLSVTGLSVGDICSSVFGLAGADTEKQHVEIGKRIAGIGLKGFKVCNDAFLGLKAGSKRGYGICSNIGTGTTCGVIDRHGNMLQIGGLGDLSGDDAGGQFISNKVLRIVYESIYKSGQQTLMKEILFDILGILDEKILVDSIYEKVSTGIIPRSVISSIAFIAANKGDAAALELLKQVGRSVAKPVIEAFKRFDFSEEEEIDILLAGSIYAKGENPTIMETLKSELAEKIGTRLRYCLVKEPPVAGAVLWAYEELHGIAGEALREKILHSAQKMAP